MCQLLAARVRVQMQSIFRQPQFDELDFLARQPDGPLVKLSEAQLEQIRANG